MIDLLTRKLLTIRERISDKDKRKWYYMALKLPLARSGIYYVEVRHATSTLVVIGGHRGRPGVGTHP